jgi:hypothetical protein
MHVAPSSRSGIECDDDRLLVPHACDAGMHTGRSIFSGSSQPQQPEADAQHRPPAESHSMHSTRSPHSTQPSALEEMIEAMAQARVRELQGTSEGVHAVNIALLPSHSAQRMGLYTAAAGPSVAPVEPKVSAAGA